jgi:hypothetical protein
MTHRWASEMVLFFREGVLAPIQSDGLGRLVSSESLVLMMEGSDRTSRAFHFGGRFVLVEPTRRRLATHHMNFKVSRLTLPQGELMTHGK